MIKAAIFDMDGTMFDTERLSFEGWTLAAKWCGYPLSAEQKLAFRGRSRIRNWHAFQSWFGEDSAYWSLRAIRNAYVKRQVADSGVPFKPGLIELLEYLRSSGIRTCIATGTDRAAASAYWEKCGILRYFDDTVCGDEVTLSKPDPEIFLTAAQKINTPPENCLVFEDSPNGARAANAANCHLFLIPDLDMPDEEIRGYADAVGFVLTDGINWIQSYNDASLS